MKITILKKSFALLLVVFFAGCSTTAKAPDFSGLGSPDGKPIAHISKTNYGVSLLMGKQPLWGDASLKKTVADFTSQAKAEGASKVRIVQSNSMSLWFLFFPITLVLTPEITNVAGEAIQ